MQKRGVLQKGFFLTVVLILGAVLVVSFMNQGTTGKAIEDSSELMETSGGDSFFTSAEKTSSPYASCACNIDLRKLYDATMEYYANCPKENRLPAVLQDGCQGRNSLLTCAFATCGVQLKCIWYSGEIGGMSITTVPGQCTWDY